MVECCSQEIPLQRKWFKSRHHVTDHFLQWAMPTGGSWGVFCCTWPVSWSIAGLCCWLSLSVAVLFTYPSIRGVQTQSSRAATQLRFLSYQDPTFIGEKVGQKLQLSRTGAGHLRVNWTDLMTGNNQYITALYLATFLVSFCLCG